MTEQKKQLEFTGERFLPDCPREIWYEHYHRYAMARPLVAGKKVLDAACGEGYGSHLLSQSAKSVLGVDLSESTITHAQNTYQADNLSFIQADVLQLEMLPDCSFEVVVSFETLEHLVEHQQLLSEFKRVLVDDGLLIISTPDKAEYSDKQNHHNQFHLKELYQNEFDALLSSEFSYRQWFGQKLFFQSAIWRLNQSLNTLQLDTPNQDGQLAGVQMPFKPMYFIVLAANRAIDEKLSDYCSFTDQEQSVYQHYQEMIKGFMFEAQQNIELKKNQQRWLKHPIIGRCIKWFGGNKNNGI